MQLNNGKSLFLIVIAFTISFSCHFNIKGGTNKVEENTKKVNEQRQNIPIIIDSLKKRSIIKFLNNHKPDTYNISADASTPANHPFSYYLNCSSGDSTGLYTIHYIGKNSTTRGKWKKNLNKIYNPDIEDESTVVQNQLNPLSDYYKFAVYIDTTYFNQTRDCTIESFSLKKMTLASVFYYQDNSWSYLDDTIINITPFYLSNSFFIDTLRKNTQ